MQIPSRIFFFPFTEHVYVFKFTLEKGTSATGLHIQAKIIMLCKKLHNKQTNTHTHTCTYVTDQS